ncbi:hypothetical protein BU17DRAFT_55011 [Hysterangium stoloniferum]|nr:hypothetical protein BU17DRAFT_55011 [Hysterangium stoloniferum]
MDTLSRREEEALLKTTKARALKECDSYVKDCVTGRTISVAWACRDQHKEVQKCMLNYTNAENMDILRAEYVRLRSEHRQKEANGATPS